MEWIQVLVILATFVSLFVWNRTESRTDCRQMDEKIETHRREIIQMQREMQRETNAIIEAIRQDMKDFHGRLCTIEERNRKDK